MARRVNEEGLGRVNENLVNSNIKRKLKFIEVLSNLVFYHQAQAGEQLSPASFGLPVAIFNRDQLLAAVLGDPDNHQQAEPVIQADIAVDTVGPPINVTLLAQVSPLPVPVVIPPINIAC